MAHATFLNQNISINLVQNIINHVPASAKRQINFEIITQNVSGYYKIDPELLYTKTRKREVSDARQMVMYLAKNISTTAFHDNRRTPVAHPCHCASWLQVNRGASDI